MGDEQQVGYGNPPKGSRFKKGQSGNRRGRPKGSKNLKTDLTEELQTEIKVREGPRAIKISIAARHRQDVDRKDLNR